MEVEGVILKKKEVDIMLPWLIASVAILMLIVLWFRSVKREIAPLWEAVQGADKQARLYWGLLMGVQDDPDKKAYMQELYDQCCMIYVTQTKMYHDSVCRSFNAPVAWLLGYRPVPSEIDL